MSPDASPRALSIPSRRPRETVKSYMERARRTLRLAGPAASYAWKSAYESGLAEAYRLRDWDGYSAIAMLAAVGLELEERREEALAQIDFALGMAQDAPDVTSLLLGGKAIYNGFLGRDVDARRDIASAGEAVRRSESKKAQLDHVTNRGMLDCILLQVNTVDEVAAAISEADQTGSDAQGSALKTWLVAYLFATGRAKAAEPWIEALRIQAAAVGHPARAADAAAFARALQLAAGHSPTEKEDALAHYNPNATWRADLLALRWSLYTGDLTGARESAAALGRPGARFCGTLPSGVNPYEVLVERYRGAAAVDAQPWSSVTVVNLPAILACIEAVAIGGTQTAAHQWRDWIERNLPATVRTSLEWPVAVDRIVGLLELRGGASRRAVARLRRAVEWADSTGYALEGAIARVQLAETVLQADIQAKRTREIRALREAGWETLAALKVPPFLHAYAVSQALALRMSPGREPQLSRREVEVLELLAEGLSYKEIGERLGIGWRTAQVHSYNVYRKLDVRGKVQAVTVAREIGIL